MQKRFWPTTFLFLMLSGCKVGPVYEPPCIEYPTEWHGEVPKESDDADPGAVIWWENLQDPTLNELMHYAASQNLDLKIASLRVLQARTEAKGKKADLYPHIDGSVAYDHAYFSKEAAVHGLRHLGVPVKSNRVRRNINLYEFGFDAEWELDFFGFTRHEIAALKAQEEAAEETLCGVWVTLSAEIAKNYIELRGLQQRREILRNILEDQTNVLRLTQELVDRGLVNESDYLQVQAEWGFMQSELPTVELNINRSIHRLSILLGYPPGDLFELLAPCGNLPQIPCSLSIGIPSDLLRRRPDIRKAERDLAAATERVGSAVAALFPRFSLRGFVGDISTKSGALFNPASTTWFAGPLVLVPIFNSRLLLQDVEYNKMATQEALFTYQKTVLEALEESENAIAAFRHESERLHFLTKAYQDNQTALALVNDLHQRGVNDNFAVNKAKKAALTAKDVMVQNHVELLLSYVALYKALGGSWECNAETAECSEGC